MLVVDVFFVGEIGPDLSRNASRCLVYLQEKITVGWIVRLASMPKLVRGLLVFEYQNTSS